MFAEQAVLAILTGRADAGLSVEGVLDLRGVMRPFRLPSGLSVDGNLLLSGSAVTEIPDNVSVSGGISAARCSSLLRIGDNVRAQLLEAPHCGRLETVGGPLNSTTLNFEGCTALTQLPERIKGTHLSLRGCAALESLPKDLNVSLLHLNGCRRLRVDPGALDRIGLVTVDELTPLRYDWRGHQVDEHLAAHWLVSGAARGGLNTGTLSLAHHTWLRSLPENMIVGGDLNLEGCTNLAALPEHLTVNGTLTLTGCRGVREMPASLRARKLILPDGRAGQAIAPEGSFLDLLKSVGVAARVLQQLGTLQQPTLPRQAVSSADARTAILAGEQSVVVRDELRLDGLTELQALPNRLWVFGNLTLENLPSLRTFPRDFRVTGQMRIENCAALEQLPPLNVDMITIAHCPALTALPAITCSSLSIHHCHALEIIPDAIAAHDNLSISDCNRISRSATRSRSGTCRCETCHCSSVSPHRRRHAATRSRNCRSSRPSRSARASGG